MSVSSQTVLGPESKPDWQALLGDGRALRRERPPSVPVKQPPVPRKAPSAELQLGSPRRPPASCAASSAPRVLP
eukprot:9428060-Alexandrium_andersonii.AAC.1